jgi:hypothetical protein
MFWPELCARKKALFFTTLHTSEIFALYRSAKVARLTSAVIVNPAMIG